MSNNRLSSRMAKRKAPKQRNLEKTKALILDTAQKAFALTGFARTGIRQIATGADVSPALVLRYFGSKAGLFEAALKDAMRETELFAAGKAGFGKRMSRMLSAPDVDVKLPAMMVLSTGDLEANAITARITREHIIAPLAQWLGPPDAVSRAATIIMVCTGFVLYTRQLPVMSPPRKMVDWFALTLQAIVDEAPPRAHAMAGRAQ